MEIYDLVLDEHRSRFSSTEKIFMLLLYRKMAKENLTSSFFNLIDLSEEFFVSRIIARRAFIVAEELGLLEKKVFHEDGSKKVKITIKKGL